MIARGFKPVAWVAAVGTAALGCYMLSLRVASERAELSGLESKIVSTERAIRSLQTELGTRGRVTQLQQWNEEILALDPPEAGQFVENPVLLARYDTRRATLDDQAEVRMASAETSPTASVTPPAQRTVAPARPAPQAVGRPVVQRASLSMGSVATLPAPARTRPATQPTTTRAVATDAAARTRPVPVADSTRTQRTRAASADSATRARTGPASESTRPQRTRTASAEPSRRPAATPARAPARAPRLLDERTVRDLGAAARSERGGGTRN